MVQLFELRECLVKHGVEGLEQERVASTISTLSVREDA